MERWNYYFKSCQAKDAGTMDSGWNGGRPGRHFQHELMICDILSSIEIGTRGDPRIRFISWPEILANPKMPERTRRAAKPLAARVPVKQADNVDTAASGPARQRAGAETPLDIPYGNKEIAMKLGARYRSGGWYAPPGVDLTAFEERGWQVKETQSQGK